MPAEPSLLTIDGSHGEGGGALLRTALAMSAMTQQPMRMMSVRQGTRHPGLDPEDLTIIRALEESTAAECTGVLPGSTSFTFAPARTAKGISGRLASIRNESNRGPNALVVLTTLLPIMARSGVYCSVTSTGETFGAHSLGYDSFADQTLEVLRAIGLYAYPSLVSAGFGRESRGEVSLEVEPSHLDGLQWMQRGLFVDARAVVTTANVSASIGSRAVSHLKSMARNSNMPMETELVEVDSIGHGCHISVSIRYEKGMGGGAAMGARTVWAETLAQAAFEEAFDWRGSDACIDPYLADQILLPCVFAEEPSSFTVSRLTKRFLTSVWVVKQFLPIHLTVRGSENHAGVVTIKRS